jgi:hypothetical protein
MRKKLNETEMKNARVVHDVFFQVSVEGELDFNDSNSSTRKSANWKLSWSQRFALSCLCIRIIVDGIIARFTERYLR